MTRVAVDLTSLLDRPHRRRRVRPRADRAAGRPRRRDPHRVPSDLAGSPPGRPPRRHPAWPSSTGPWPLGPARGVAAPRPPSHRPLDRAPRRGVGAELRGPAHRRRRWSRCTTSPRSTTRSWPTGSPSPTRSTGGGGRGAWVHTPSEFVRGEVIEHFGVDPDRVVMAPTGSRARWAASRAPAPPWRGRPLPARRRHGRAPQDLPTLVAAFDDLAARHPDLRLVIAGADGWGAEALTGRRRGPPPPPGRAPRLGRRRRAGRPRAGGRRVRLPVPVRGVRAAAGRGHGGRHPGGGHPGRLCPRCAGTAPTLVPPGTPRRWPAPSTGSSATPTTQALVARGRAVAAGYDWDATADRFAALIGRVATSVT